jgi:hypothetical protein
MDTNYLLKREQVSLALAQNAESVEARCAHRNLAKAYGALLAKGTFPHRQAVMMADAGRRLRKVSAMTVSRRALDRWADDGGSEPNPL